MRCSIGILISLIFDVVSIVAILNMDSLPILVVQIICKLYLVSLIGMVYLALSYICTDVCIDTKKHRKITLKYKALTLCFGIIVLLLPIDIYYDAQNNTAHTFGMSAYAACLCAGLLLIAIVYQIIKGRKVINHLRRKAMRLWLVIWVIAIIIQMGSGGSVLLIGYASVLGIMIVYLMLENPMENIDRITGLYNQNALLHYVRQLYQEKENFVVLAVNFQGAIWGCLSPQAEYKVSSEIVEFLLKVPKAVTFKNVDKELLLIFKTRDDAEKGIEMVQKKFSKTLNCFYILIPDANVVDSVEDLLYLLKYTKENSTDLMNNHVLCVSERMVEEIISEREVEKIIFSAMENDHVEVFYQPIYSTKEQQFTAAEALVRIRDEAGNLISPAEFIPIAEKNGMILRLGEMVFDKVCRFIKETDILQYGVKYIEVNLSVVQCAYENLAQSYIGIMKKYDINPKHINLEITESASLSAKKALLENMKALMEYGVTFSLDDFGTGQSNLNYIVDMPVEIVKFDRSMINAYFENKKAKYVMDAAMLMIHGMKLYIVSEGIETKEQFETMKELKINYIQGYYFSKPLPQQEYLKFIEGKNHS